MAENAVEEVSAEEHPELDAEERHGLFNILKGFGKRKPKGEAPMPATDEDDDDDVDDIDDADKDGVDDDDEEDGDIDADDDDSDSDDDDEDVEGTETPKGKKGAGRMAKDFEFDGDDAVSLFFGEDHDFDEQTQLAINTNPVLETLAKDLGAIRTAMRSQGNLRKDIAADRSASEERIAAIVYSKVISGVGKLFQAQHDLMRKDLSAIRRGVAGLGQAPWPTAGTPGGVADVPGGNGVMQKDINGIYGLGLDGKGAQAPETRWGLTLSQFQEGMSQYDMATDNPLKLDQDAILKAWSPDAKAHDRTLYHAAHLGLGIQWDDSKPELS